VSGSFGARLADATPWVILDVVELAVFVFLVSRLWVVFVPTLGRRLARYTLAIAVPLLLVASVTGHMAAPQKAAALSDGVGFTVFLVSIPIGVWWSGALVIRWTRRLLRRQESTGTPHLRRATEWLRVGVVTVPVVGLVALVQWQLCRDETKALDRRAEALRTTIKALEITEKKADEFDREWQLLAEKLELLAKMVPRSPAVEEFVTRFDTLAAEYEMKVVDWSGGDPAGPTRDVLQEYSVTVMLSGQVERLRDLAERSYKVARLVVWQRASVHDRNATVRLSIYAAPDRAATKRHDSCVDPLSKVWLWPYTAKLRIAHVEIDRLCSERARHAATQAKVDDFTVKKYRLEELVNAIESLRAKRRLPEIEVEPGATATAAPVTRKEA